MFIVDWVISKVAHIGQYLQLVFYRYTTHGSDSLYTTFRVTAVSLSDRVTLTKADHFLRLNDLLFKKDTLQEQRRRTASKG